MRITRRQLRRLIRESLLRENPELKKLKKLFVSGIEHHEQAWELADTLGLAGQVEAMMRTDFKFLKKMTKLGQSITTDEQEDFIKLIEYPHAAYADYSNPAGSDIPGWEGNGPLYTPRTRTGKAFKAAMEDSAFEMIKSGLWNKNATQNLSQAWLTPEEQQQLDPKKETVSLPLESSNPSLHSALFAELDEISTMTTESDALWALIENMTAADTKALGLSSADEWVSMGYGWQDAVNDLTPDIAKKIAKKLGVH